MHIMAVELDGRLASMP